MKIEDNIQSPHPGSVPKTKIVWPTVQHTSNQVQQTLGSAKPQVANVLPTTQPSQSSVQPGTTPAVVSNVRVVTKKAVNGNKQVTVQFTHPGGSQYFAGANVYLKKGRGQPSLVGAGAQSPITFTVPTSTAPHTVHVTSTGNWGETDVLSSPSRRVRLI